MYKFTDSHCHIAFDDNIDEIVKNMKINGIIKAINNGYDAKSNQETLDIYKKYNILYPAMGIHPENIDKTSFEEINCIENNIQNIVAIGEIGLDYYHSEVSKELQIDIFEKQLDLAIKYSKPVIIHSRNANDDLIRILSKKTARGVIHCFDGNIKEAEVLINLGFKLGLNGIITFKNYSKLDMIRQLPLNSIILETDSPYLAPVPVRGTINEPCNIIHIANKICEVKNITLDELSSITEANIKEVFDI